MSDRLYSDAEVSQAVSDFTGQFQGKIAHRIYHLGDKAGVVVSPSDPSLYNALDESGSPVRIRRNDLSETTPAGTAIYVGETQGHQDTYAQEYGIAIPQIGNYAGQTYKTAWVGPLKIAVGAATSGNIVGSTFLTYDDTVNQIDLYGNSSPAIAIHSFGVRGAFTHYAANGVKGAPTAITTGQEILRCFSAFGHGTTIYGPNSVGRIGVWSTENYTDTATGAELRFSSTPNGTNAPAVGLTLGQDQALTLAAAFVTTGEITPTILSASVNDYAPTGIARARTVRLSANAAWNITGLIAGAAGEEKTLINVGANNITLKTASGSSAAANRFSLKADIVLAQFGSVQVRYDATLTNWLCIASY